MKSFIASLLFCLSFGAGVSAQGPIEGAFGQKLGAVFDPDDAAAPPVTESDPYVTRHRFTPVAPFKGLTDYFVDVSPTTHRIYCILASGTAEADSARQLTTLLDIILREKYADDPPEPRPPEPGPGRARVRVIREADASGDLRTKIVQAKAKRSIVVFYKSDGGFRVRDPDNSDRVEMRATVHLTYRDEAVAEEASKEAEAIKREKDARLAAEAAVQEKAAQEARESQEAEKARKLAEERARLTQEAAKLDKSGL
jgi:hypothetical protein